MADEIQIEEMLEYIWILEENDGKAESARMGDKFGSDITNTYLTSMVEEQLINLHDSGIVFTKTGKKRAELIIRRHRIAERLLNDVLEMRGDEFERGACQFEHFVNEEIIASICTLLGHPAVCPHGNKIPQGECCLSAKKNLEPVISPLSLIKAGKKVKVVYISTKSHTSLDRLTGIGVIPGLELTIHQKFPSMILEYGETQLALDNDIAKNIFVRIIQN
ncbi:MAG: metal-dependent transcriptional regulator [Candidatus Scalindua sp.]|jgi:DtxR family Mn-dependent transcriptional regulator|nr:metal-dependent transcriptional regulator [Candidatus Scalindua sp.]MBT5306342.1 metal-dependent transcriptional regulator [Candidatus Scalindua sp.]MBT6047624.1 metal-dependent transcriptional regulator [Candidatus Scalindua sp.]MBT6230664.1 metal-dependent transcriptional regulator [Candidatus Scalindua sp.]MBT6564182.1 metal-dependent transcriptional regulator [Candidatus Scalindua sp.]